MKVQIYLFGLKPIKGRIFHDLIPTHLGYVEVDNLNTEDDAEDIFDLCNWSNWTEEKPKNLHIDIFSNYNHELCCNHGLCLVNPETQERWLALSQGWLVGDENTISEYVFEHRHDLLWN